MTPWFTHFFIRNSTNEHNGRKKIFEIFFQFIGTKADQRINVYLIKKARDTDKIVPIDWVRKSNIVSSEIQRQYHHFVWSSEHTLLLIAGVIRCNHYNDPNQKAAVIPPVGTTNESRHPAAFWVQIVYAVFFFFTGTWFVEGFVSNTAITFCWSVSFFESGKNVYGHAIYFSL